MHSRMFVRNVTVNAIARSKRRCRCIHSRVRITRDVRYSDAHERNLLDIYEPDVKLLPRREPSNGLDRPPTLLFVHGGMWMRGSKDQSVLSARDVAYSALSSLFDHNGSSPNSDGSEQDSPGVSNVGATVAAHGGDSLIINYRLASGDDTPNAGQRFESDVGNAADGEKQVRDVARAIAFSIERELEERRDKHDSENIDPNIFICGHSAGAHLAAVALCHRTYLRAALEERCIDSKVLDRVLAGFIGISGVFNLKRLSRMSTKDITIGPAFLPGLTSGKDEDVLSEVSPVHVLLQAHAEFVAGKDPTNSVTMPPLATIQTLLLNAGSDFHLEQDSEEMICALGHFSSDQPVPRAERVTVMSSDHLSIIGNFGSGVEHFDASSDSVHLRKQQVSMAWGLEELIGNQFAKTAINLFGLNVDKNEGDETSRRVLEFMKLR